MSATGSFTAAVPATGGALLGVVVVLVSLPGIVATAFALVDILGRRDLTRARKLVYAAGVVLVLPVTLLYLLSRPTSLVRHRTDPVVGTAAEDWRRGLVAVLDAPVGSPPSVSSGELRGMINRIQRADDPTRVFHGGRQDPEAT